MTSMTLFTLGYIGPGAGIGLIGALFGLVMTVGMALFMVVLWPIRSMLRKVRSSSSPHSEAGTGPVVAHDVDAQAS